MYKNIFSTFIILCALWSFDAYAQAGNYMHEWTTYTNNNIQGVSGWTSGIIADADDHVYIIRVELDTVYEKTLGALSKFSPEGQLVWTSDDIGEALGLAIDHNGDILILGITIRESGITTPGAFQTEFGGGIRDAFLMKYSPDGEKIWGTYIGGDGDESDMAGPVANYYFGLNIDQNNDLIFFLYTKSEGLGTPGTFQSEANGAGMLIAKFNTDGQRIWSTYYGPDSDLIYDYNISGMQTDETGIYISGIVQTQFEGDPGYFDTTGDYVFEPQSRQIYVSKFDHSGNRVWSHFIESNDLLFQRRNNLAISGDYLYLTFSAYNIWGTIADDFGTEGTSFPEPGEGMGPGVLLKMDKEGTALWSTFLPTAYDNPQLSFPSILIRGSEIYVYGKTLANAEQPIDGLNSTIEDTYSFYLMKFDEDGQVLLSNYADNSGNDLAAVRPLGLCFYSSGIYLFGSTEGIGNIATPGTYQDEPFYEPPFANSFLSKYLDKTIMSVQEQNTIDFTVYPNPAGSVINILLEDHTVFPVYITLYNSLGQQLITQEISEPQTTLNLITFSPGVYFLNLEANQKTSVKKIVIR